MSKIHKTIRATLPPPDTDARRDWLKAVSDIVGEVLLTHADGDKAGAMTGLMILTQRTVDVIEEGRKQ
jgi:hypothetical protein